MGWGCAWGREGELEKREVEEEREFSRGVVGWGVEGREDGDGSNEKGSCFTAVLISGS